MSELLYPFWDYLRELFSTRLPYFPANIRSALFIVLFCCIAFIELYLYIFVRRIKQTIAKKKEDKWNDTISTLLADIIIYGDDDDTDTIINHFLPQFKKLPLRRPLIKKLLTRELLSYHANFIGKTAEVLRGLYLRLNLEKEAKAKLKSNYWEKNIEGIREITQMNLRTEAESILKFTDEENGQLRMEAQAAFVKLSDDDPFRFLDRARERILDWHQLVLFEVITKTKNVKIPAFSKWLKSENDSVVMLCLKLVNHFQQWDAIPDMVMLFGHSNLKIRARAIENIGRMEAEMVEENLFNMYLNQPFEIKLLVIEAIGRISSGTYLEFLKSRTYSDDFKIRMAALKAIKLHGSTGLNLLSSIYKDSTLQNRAIIEHVLDERIKN